jgi:hypothetical protein
MDVFMPVLISVTSTLGLIALGVGWIVMAPLSSHTDDQGASQGMNTIGITCTWGSESTRVQLEKIEKPGIYQ